MPNYDQFFDVEQFKASLVLAGLNQREAAQRANLSPNTLTQWSIGRTSPSARSLAAVTKVINEELAKRGKPGINPADLFRFPGFPKGSTSGNSIAA